MIKLHLGCGGIHKEGYINVDIRKTVATDIEDDCRVLNDVLVNSVELIESYHLIEHLPRPGSQYHQGFDIVLKRWYKLLKFKGKLIIECPDFDAVVAGYIKGITERKDNIFGLDRFRGDVHHWGYGFKDLKELLEAAGFVNVVRREPTDYHKDLEPCMRVECNKP